MSVPLLSTKLSMPPVRSRMVARSKLIQRLNFCLDCGFILISAPAGYGKTTLMSDWMSQVEFAHTWLTLDSGDNDPVRFLTYLAAAIRQVHPSVGEVLEISLQASALPAVEVFLTPVINRLNQADPPFWLVLDDYHVIQNQVVHQVVNYLLEHRPKPFHLVIATRADPPFPLSRLRAGSQMIELRLVDLRFSGHEVKEFFTQVIGVSLSEEDLFLLETSTEGWIAGLQMAGLSLQNKEDTSRYIRSFSGENRYILDYLFDEVFRQQPEEIQDFLLRTCILGQLCASLCDQIVPRENSQSILDTLERNNLFLIALDEQRQWYRYHHLFGDLLRSRLRQSFPDEKVLLHQRASAWYETRHDLEKAIYHSLAAQDFEGAADLIEQIAKNLDTQNKQPVLAGWVKSLPRGILEAHPWLCVYRAWGDYWMGRRGLEEEWLRLAEASIERTFVENHLEKRHLQGYIAAVRAHTALVAGDISQALAAGQKALDLLPKDDGMRFEAAIALGGAYWALGDVVRSEQAFGANRESASKVRYTSVAAGAIGYAGIQQVKQGRLREAMITFQEALHLATLPDGNQAPVAGFPNIRLGDVLRERNELSLAAHYLVRGVEQCVQFNQPDVLTDAYVCLGRYQLAMGDFQQAYETLQKGDWVAQHSQVDPWVLCWLDDLRLRLWLTDGKLESADRWVQSSGLSPDGPLSYQHDLHHQNLARVLVARGRVVGSRTAHEDAAALLARLRTAAEQAGWVHEGIRFLVLQAVNDQAFQKNEAALKSLARAVSLAEPGAYVRVFLDEGESMRGLLIALDRSIRNDRRDIWDRLEMPFEGDQWTAIRGYVSRLGDAAKSALPFLSAEQTSGGSGMVEPLSPREMEVLRLLAQGHSDKTIAQILVIARETVHKHLKNIYGKLDVHSRTAAVARARELGLL